MAKPRKVIITCAITGSIHTPSMSPHLPVTSQQIADSAIGAAEAGAAIVHLHARNPEDGRPDQTPEAFEPFLKVIKQRSNVVMNITTGGAPTMTPEERVRPAATFKPEVASLNMGTMNFGLYPMIPRYKGKFKHAWEEQYLEGSRKSMFKNTLADIEYILTLCSENNTRFEIECYDIGHLYTLRHFVDRGVVKPPLFVQSVFGILGRHRDASRGYHHDEAHRGSPVRRRLPLVGARRRRQSNADRGHGGDHGRQRAGRPGKLAMDRSRQARRVERTAGHTGAQNPRRPRPRDRILRRGAGNSLSQRRGPGEFLIVIPGRPP